MQDSEKLDIIAKKVKSIDSQMGCLHIMAICGWLSGWIVGMVIVATAYSGAVTSPFEQSMTALLLVPFWPFIVLAYAFGLPLGPV